MGTSFKCHDTTFLSAGNIPCISLSTNEVPVVSQIAEFSTTRKKTQKLKQQSCPKSRKVSSSEIGLFAAERRRGNCCFMMFADHSVLSVTCRTNSSTNTAGENACGAGEWFCFDSGFKLFGNSDVPSLAVSEDSPSV